ncbi:hypothetical protein SCAR479_10583 [Seiridium cardinale]|uniref:Uncharacterized protein n=1 Tax=Seiridium cardinale TaxID=138064 RepID=A0ABR2XFY0_9PEZI
MLFAWCLYGLANEVQGLGSPWVPQQQEQQPFSGFQQGVAGFDPCDQEPIQWGFMASGKSLSGRDAGSFQGGDASRQTLWMGELAGWMDEQFVRSIFLSSMEESCRAKVAWELVLEKITWLWLTIAHCHASPLHLTASILSLAVMPGVTVQTTCL